MKVQEGMEVEWIEVDRNGEYSIGEYSIVDDSTVDDSIVDSIEDSIVKNAIRQKCELLIIIQFTFYDILLEK